MKKHLHLVFFLIFTCYFSHAALAAPSNQLVKEAQQFPAGSFQDPNMCMGCHPRIHSEWSHSMHAYAWKNKWYQQDYRFAHQETGGATDVFCGACHAPIAARTGQLPPHDGSKFDQTALQGISCDFCHTASAVERTHNMGHISTPGAVKYGNRGDGKSPFHGVKYSELHRSGEFCGSCHSVQHPVSKVAVIDTYNEWKSSSYAQQGITCQDCHMTQTPGVTKNPGKSSPMGMERDNVAYHGFVGGSSFAQRLMGNEAQAKLAEEMLKAAAKIEMEATPSGGQLALIVHVDNIGAGHSIPTGVTYIRKMWLEVKLEDRQGKVYYHSGFVDKQNHVDKNAVFYRLLFRDAEGQLTGKSWRATDIGYDRRIPANGRDTEVYTIPLPAKGEFTATARLMYRSFAQETLNFHEGEKAPQIESVEMARKSATFTY